MNLRTFLSELHKAYPFDPIPGQLKLMVGFLRKQDEAIFPFLLGAVALNHSATFKTFPDAAILKSVMGEAEESLKAHMMVKAVTDRGRLMIEEKPHLATDDDIDRFADDIRSIFKAK